MIRPIVLCLSLSLAAVNSIPAQTAPPAPASAYELPPVFQASQILDRSLLIGPNHRVRELAYGDGYLIHFTVDSDFGTYDCVGIHDLQRRVREIHAIASLV
ncbi:MAG: hypothetical protein KDM63_19895, partial [Verrucomicrobiae bacterium]|nr:hypothetical protein [Verrucomicrobiae bacterium]